MAVRRSEEMQLVAYALSRCSAEGKDGKFTKPPEWLRTQTWAETYAMFFPKLGDGRTLKSFANSLKNARDAFDAHLPSSRVGWVDRYGDAHREDVMVGRIMSRWHDRSSDEVQAAIFQILGRASGSRNSPPPPVNVGPDWSSIFDDFGIKQVTKTDKAKKAYVLNDEQRAVLAAAGIFPRRSSSAKPIRIKALFDPAPIIEASYYNSVRSGSGRTPEARMGKGIISWAQIGDQLVIGRINGEVFVARSATKVPTPDVARDLARKLNRRDILKRAKAARGRPKRANKTISDFVRNPYVVAGALLRSSGTCEMPRCILPLFQRDDGTNFLEVHHITPLSEDGVDELDNAAALCPSCHRELHYGKDRMSKRIVLARHVKAIAANI